MERIVFIKIDNDEKREEFYKACKDGKEDFVGTEVCTKLN